MPLATIDARVTAITRFGIFIRSTASVILRTLTVYADLRSGDSP